MSAIILLVNGRMGYWALEDFRFRCLIFRGGTTVAAVVTGNVVLAATQGQSTLSSAARLLRLQALLLLPEGHIVIALAAN